MAFTYTGEKVDLGFGRGWLNRPAAESIQRIDARLGHPLQITEAGRSWADQNKHYQHYLRYGSPIALNPDTPSLHQKGNAVDTNEGQRVHAMMEEHGFRRTVYRWVAGIWTLVEPWHYEYFPELDKHRGGSSAGGGGGDMPLNEADLTNIRMSIQRALQYEARPNGFGATGVHGPTLWERIDRLEKALGDIVRALPAEVWKAPVQAQDSKGIPQSKDGKPITFPASGFLASISGQTDALTKGGGVDAEALAKSLAPMLSQAMVKLSPAELTAMAKAVNDEQDRRDREGRQ